MIPLASLLVKNRTRQISRNGEWPARISAGLLPLLLLLRLVFFLYKTPDGNYVALSAKLLSSLLLSWAMLGVLTGRDLTWRISASELKQCHVGFNRLFFITWTLASASIPFLLTILLLSIAWSSLLPGIPWITAFVSAVLLAYTQRAIIFSFRNLLRVRSALSAPLIVATLLASLAYLAFIWRFWSWWPHHPQRSGTVALCLACCCAVVLTLSFFHERQVFRFGAAANGAGSSLLASAAVEYLRRASESSVMFRIAMLGWIRTRSGVPMYLWACVYGFGYPFVTNMKGKLSYIIFGWMVLVFHCYLRGNLLGVEHQGLMLMWSSRERMEAFFRAKSASFTAIQLSMVAAVFAASIAHPVPLIRGIESWVFCSEAVVVLVLAGEVAGAWSSLWGASAIEREAYYSGSMTMGAVILPIIQLVSVAAYCLAVWALERHVSSSVALDIAGAGIALLLLMRAGLMARLLPEVLCNRREIVLDGFNLG